MKKRSQERFELNGAIPSPKLLHREEASFSQPKLGKRSTGKEDLMQLTHLKQLLQECNWALRPFFPSHCKSQSFSDGLHDTCKGEAF
jgi:hypothetical protein